MSAKTGKNVIELFQDKIYPEMEKVFHISGDQDDTPSSAPEKVEPNVDLCTAPIKKKKGCCGGK